MQRISILISLIPNALKTQTSKFKYVSKIIEQLMGHGQKIKDMQVSAVIARH